VFKVVSQSWRKLLDWMLTPFTVVAIVARAKAFFYARSMTATPHRAFFKVDVIDGPVLYIETRRTATLLDEAEAHGFGQRSK
jgi:hypothetical protein